MPHIPIHHLTYLGHKIAQNQAKQDSDVINLVERLSEMAGLASAWEEPREIPGTVNVIEDIAKATLEAATLVHDYVHPSIQGKGKFLGTCYLLVFSSSDVAHHAFSVNQRAP